MMSAIRMLPKQKESSMSRTAWKRSLAAGGGAIVGARSDGSVLYFASRETLQRYRTGAS